MVRSGGSTGDGFIRFHPMVSSGRRRTKADVAKNYLCNKYKEVRLLSYTVLYSIVLLLIIRVHNATGTTVLLSMNAVLMVVLPSSLLYT